MSRLHALLTCGLALAIATPMVSSLAACGGAGAYPSSQRRSVTQTGSRSQTPDRLWSAPPERPVPKVRERYGLWVGALDAFSTTLFMGSIATENERGRDSEITGYLRVGGVLGYIVGTPLMHRLYGNSWATGASFLLRATVPLTAVVVAELNYGCGFEVNPTCELAAPVGLLVGAAITTLFDGWFFAKRWRPARPDEVRRLSIAPMAIVTEERQILGLGGRF